MSSRQIRKLQKQKEHEVAAQNSEDSEENDEPIVAKPRVSLFAALGGGDDEDEDEDEDEAQQSPPAQQEVIEAPKPTGSKSKKKKKKKAKAKAKAIGEAEDSGAPGAKEDEGEDEIDKALKELKIKDESKPSSSSPAALGSEASASAQRLNAILSINTYHLKAINEMRNLFGREIIESAEAEEEQERNRRHRGPAQQQVDLETFLRGPPNQKKLSEVSLRRNVFIQGREHWPRQTAGGLTMNEVARSPSGDWVEYAYVYDKTYDAAQTTFFAYVQMGDPMRMVQLLGGMPYHVSTLLQVSSVAKQDQNMSLAAELCERALFSFGRVTTSAFRQDMEQGRARLEFRRPENRQFWLAGYHYIKSLIRKGTYRTALEWAKLLFSMDAADPYGMRHLMHPLAIRAHEARWLVDFIAEMEAAAAVAGQGESYMYIRQTQVLAKLQMGDADGARADLEAGIKRLPWLYSALFQELNLDTPPSIWGISADTDSRLFWVRLYTTYTKDLWNNTQAVDLLQSVAKSMDKLDASALPSTDPPVGLDSTRLVYLEGHTTLLEVAPRALLDSQPNYEFDPLPPPKEENIFTSPCTLLPWGDDFQRTRAPQGNVVAWLQGILDQFATRREERGEEPVPVEMVGDAINDLLGDQDLMEAVREDAPTPADIGQTLIEMLQQRFGLGGPVAREEAEGPERQVEGQAETQAERQAEEPQGPIPGAWPEDD